MASLASKAERRVGGRHALGLDVTLHVGGGGRSLRGQSIDISATGMLIRLDEPLPHGRRVDLVISGPRLSGPIATSGLVVHNVRGVGVGVRFTPRTERARAQLAELLAALPGRAR